MQTAPPPTRDRRRWLVPALVLGAAGLGVVLALTQPWLLFIDEVAAEQLPTITDDTPTATGTTTGATDASTTGGDGAADDDVMADDDMTDGEMTDGEMTDGDMSDGEMAGDDVSDDGGATEPEPSGPVVLATGSFISRDHTTTGTASIVLLEDGSRVLTIEDLATDNGPDLYVYLDDDDADAEESSFDDGIDLGRLRGNVGDLVYEIPDDVDLEDVSSVAIWCDRFSSLFGAADLVAP